jgi:hypothetical protein
MRVHTGEKPYDCPYCGRAFKDLGNMKAHCRTHTKEQFVCQICKIEYKSAKELRAHHWTHAGTVSPAAIVRPRAQPVATPQWTAEEATTESVLATSSIQTQAEVQMPVPIIEPILVTACNLTIDTNAFNQLLQQTQSSQ